MSRVSRRTANLKAQKRIHRLFDTENQEVVEMPSSKRRRLAASKDVSEWKGGSSSSESSGDELSQDAASGRRRKTNRRLPADKSSVGDKGDGLCEYERKRLRNIQENLAMMASLNLLKAKNIGAISRRPLKEKRVSKPEPHPLEPSRRSLRLQKITPEGVLLPQVSCSIAEEEEKPRWPARHPSGPLKMACLSGAMQLQEETFREEITVPVTSEVTGNSTVPSDRTAVYSRLRLRQVQKVTPKRIYSMEFHPMADKTVVAVGDTHGHLGLWDVEAAAGDHVYLYQPHTRVTSGLVFSRPPSIPILYSCSFDGTLRAADFRAGVCNEIYSTDEDGGLCLTSCDIGLQSDWLVVSQGDGTVVQVDLRAGRGPVSTWKCHEKWVKSVHLNPTNDNLLVTASNDCTVAVWDIRNASGLRSCLQRVRLSRSVNSAYFSPLSGEKLLITSMDNSISVFQSMQGCGSAVATLSRRSHNNQTGRWLTGFRARWDPRSDKYFTVGSMAPTRQVEIHSIVPWLRVASFVLRDELLTSVCSLTAIHPARPVLCGANSSGRVYYWK